jgi:multidrug efflux pump subunit AcrA (membrane-fusion protein)
MEHAMKRAVLLLALAPALACSRHEGDAEAAPAATPASASERPSGVAIPVRVAPVARRTVLETVSAPGKTAALAQQKIRAPYAGTLVELSVLDGDRVRRGQIVGAILSRDSEAAQTGAREMQRQAQTEAEKIDATRALALAEKGLIRAPLTAPSDGVVVTHGAVQGDRVDDNQELLTIAEADSLAFLVDVAQSDLVRIRPGQAVAVELAGQAGPVAGVVHDVLPAANAVDYTAPVRIDLTGLRRAPSLGLFGTARITVAEHRNAAVVPESAVLRDDITGAARLAVVDAGRARWLEVQTGLRSDGTIEITAPPLEPGRTVIVAGQVGLAEGAPVAAAP